VASVEQPARSGRLERRQLQLDTGAFVAVKDPCPVQLGGLWHLFGTGVHDGYRYEILHAAAPTPDGPWRLRRPVTLTEVSGTCVAAPGVIADGGVLHMFLQTDYNLFGGRVLHLVSTDDGDTFSTVDTALVSVPGTDQAGLYDAHPAEIGGHRYLTYSAFSTIGQPDIFLARSRTGQWSGPWEPVGPILHHGQVPGHNQPSQPGYEWGLEGAQLVELPDGRVLLNAVCFVDSAALGSRQRVFFATADRPEGPYRVLGPVLEPDHGGEVGHATATIHNGELSLFFQERPPAGAWRYGMATAPVYAAVGGQGAN
jgi:hypothetical protein